jgi:hypothetical protein
MALPFLPPDKIEPTFEALRLKAFDFDADVRPMLMDFCRYYESSWLDRVSRVDLSVYRLERSTNNENESHNSTLWRMFKTKPGLWCWVKKMNAYSLVGALNFERQLNGLPLSRPQKRATRQNLQRRRDAWNKLSANQITPLEFVFLVSHTMHEGIEVPAEELEGEADEQEDVPEAQELVDPLQNAPPQPD